jgi:hypothetical protein
MIKPSLAEDADLSTVTFPCIEQPKYDGVRGLNLASTFTGRSLDPFVGFGITDYFSRPEYLGLDGEMVLGPDVALWAGSRVSLRWQTCTGMSLTT